MAPNPDLVLPFCFSSKLKSKAQTRQEARRAEEQYARLLETLQTAGLEAVGRRGRDDGQLLIFVRATDDLVARLERIERQNDFLSGLALSATQRIPTPADRIRLVHSYITSPTSSHGLGITPRSKEWEFLESIMCLHDRDFNEQWVHAWTTSYHTSNSAVPESQIKDHFGSGVSLYFSFLRSYTQALVIPAAAGLFIWTVLSPARRAYNPIFSAILLLWSTGFSEYWAVRERIVSMKSGTYLTHRVQSPRAQYKASQDTVGEWWRRELWTLASIPVTIVFAGVLSTILTTIFVLEAFITHFYTGPLASVVKLSPTVIFVLVVPKFMAFYQSFVVSRFVTGENHKYHTQHNSSVVIKTFAMSALVSYLGLCLSAFVYIPFGEGIMRTLSIQLLSGKAGGNDHPELNPARLRDQMFAFTVTNQAINTFVEVGLPYVLRFVGDFKAKRSQPPSPKSSKKVSFEDALCPPEEREFLERVREEVALPEYDLNADYNEMIMQFGYVTMWGGVWGICAATSLINNIIELRSDAFKLTTHHRRPIPTRIDTIGPWLRVLTFITWMGAVTNASLVWLFCPRSNHPGMTQCSGTPVERAHTELFNFTTTLNASEPASSSFRTFNLSSIVPDQESLPHTHHLILTTILLALVASHVHFGVRAIIKRVLDHVVWKGSKVYQHWEARESESRLGAWKGSQGLTGDASRSLDVRSKSEKTVDNVAPTSFWTRDDGLDEIKRMSKEA